MNRNDGYEVDPKNSLVFGCYKDFLWGADESIVHKFILLFFFEDFEHCFSPKRRIKSSFPPGSLDILIGSVPKKAVHCRWWQKFESETKFQVVSYWFHVFFGPNNRFSDIKRRFKGFSWTVWILASSWMLLSFCKITFLVFPIDPQYDLWWNIYYITLT